MYLSEQQIREQVAAVLKRKQPKADVEAELSRPHYQAWIQSCVDAARRQGRLLTSQQYADYQAKRGYKAEDVVRYVGPTRMEQSPVTGQGVLRETGQLGTIMRVERRADGRTVYTFMPRVDRSLRAYAEATDVEVLTLTTADWTLFERVV